MKFKIIEYIGVIKSYEDRTGEEWTREVNIVSWNDRPAKLDVREWNSDHSRMTKGLTLTDEEAEQLAMILHNYVSERR